ncbi:hypothetical protein HMN09_00664500 [Mycena chlorophos]|uniref:PQ-loop-domain-containing protein n=1 Tax=Mycena chlorophos TaxID=658473 RepID=A0A8H6T0J7_MYCCL|nr:hypothetical protein HMN09_00664500 [Mycena chlorophos]
MPANAVAENVLGTIGTIFWSIQLVPQIWKSYKSKSTEGLSHWLVLIWGGSIVFFGPYTIIQDLNIPLILQPQLFGALSLISWGQCQYYAHPNYLAANAESDSSMRARRSARRRAILLTLLAMLLVGAFQLALVFGIRPAYRRGEEPANRAVQFLGIVSPVIIALGLIPQYLEIYRLKEVRGISIAFMVVDALGGAFSDLSLAFRAGSFDILASITYTLVVVLDGAIILSALILNPRAEKRRRRAGADSDAEVEPATGSVMEQLRVDLHRSTVPLGLATDPVVDGHAGTAPVPSSTNLSTPILGGSASDDSSPSGSMLETELVPEQKPETLANVSFDIERLPKPPGLSASSTISDSDVGSPRTG